jgi:hypothetical protein
MSFSIVIPAFNEENYLFRTLDHIYRTHLQKAIAFMKPVNKMDKLASLVLLLVGIWAAWKWRLSGDTWYLFILLSLLALVIVFDRIRRSQTLGPKSLGLEEVM